MKWKKFKKEKPTKDGPYIISYENKRKTWRQAIWNKNQQVFKGDPDEIGYHSLINPVWWAKVKL